MISHWQDADSPGTLKATALPRACQCKIMLAQPQNLRLRVKIYKRANFTQCLMLGINPRTKLFQTDKTPAAQVLWGAPAPLTACQYKITCPTNQTCIYCGNEITHSHTTTNLSDLLTAWLTLVALTELAWVCVLSLEQYKRENTPPSLSLTRRHYLKTNYDNPWMSQYIM